MTYVIETLRSELALMRAMHAVAVKLGLVNVALDLTSDIADLVPALEVLERNRDAREQGRIAA